MPAALLQLALLHHHQVPFLAAPALPTGSHPLFYLPSSFPPPSELSQPITYQYSAMHETGTALLQLTATLLAAACSCPPQQAAAWLPNHSDRKPQRSRALKLAAALLTPSLCIAPVRSLVPASPSLRP